MSAHFLILLVDFLAGLLLGGGMIRMLLRIAYGNRIFDEPDARKVHHVPVPRLGGMSFMPVIILVVALTILELYHMNLTSVHFFDNIHFVQMTYMLVSAIILYVTGVTDDLSNLNYRVKLVAQFIASAVLVSSGAYIGNMYGLFGIHELPAYVGIPLTILLVMFITNAINMIDGIDGLASGISIISLASIAMMFYVERKFVYVMIALITLGTVISFWLFNMFGKQEKRTKIFMGDTGSLTLGLILSYLIINLGGFVGHRGLTTHRNIIYYTLVFSSLMIPLLDVVRLVFFRLSRHRSPFLPDMNHIHHIVMRCGLTARQTLWFLLASVIVIILLNVLMSLATWDVNLIFFVDLVLYVLWFWLINRRSKPLPES